VRLFKQYRYVYCRILDLSDIFPSAAVKGPPKTVVKPELRNMLCSLQFYMSDLEFDKLWKRYVCVRNHCVTGIFYNNLVTSRI